MKLIRTFLTTHTHRHRGLTQLNIPAGVLATVVLVLSLSDSHAQRTYTLSEALRHAEETLELDKQRNAAQRDGDAGITSARSLPNPSFVYGNESLSKAGLPDNGEWYTGASISLDFLWKRGPRIASAQHRAQWLQFAVTRERLNLHTQIKTIFAEYAALKRNLEQHTKAHVLLDKALSVARAAVAAGDVAESVRIRLEMALRQHELDEASLQAQLLELETSLGSLVGEKRAVPSLANKEEMEYPPVAPSNEAAVTHALSNRPEIQAAKTLVAWREAKLRAQRFEVLPDAMLESGYKEVEAGQRGSYVEIAFELPVFKRQKGNVLKAEAELSQAERLLRQTERQIRSEASSAYYRWQALKQLVDESAGLGQNDTDVDALLTSAQAAFTEGEISLLEYLDSVEGYLTAAESEIQLILSYATSRIALDHALGAGQTIHSN